MAYLFLFLQSFLAATVVPFSSETVLTGMVLNGFNSTYCLVFATVGNWLGGLSSYLLGYLGKIEWIEKYLRVKHEKLLKWEGKIKKYGSYFALLCWLPFIGDIIAIALGLFKVKALPVSLFMLFGKFIRYWLIIELVTQNHLSNL